MYEPSQMAAQCNFSSGLVCNGMAISAGLHSSCVLQQPADRRIHLPATTTSTSHRSFSQLVNSSNVIRAGGHRRHLHARLLGGHRGGPGRQEHPAQSHAGAPRRACTVRPRVLPISGHRQCNLCLSPTQRCGGNASHQHMIAVHTATPLPVPWLNISCPQSQPQPRI